MFDGGGTGWSNSRGISRAVIKSRYSQRPEKLHRIALVDALREANYRVVMSHKHGDVMSSAGSIDTSSFLATRSPPRRLYRAGVARHVALWRMLSLRMHYHEKR